MIRKLVVALFVNVIGDGANLGNIYIESGIIDICTKSKKKKVTRVVRSQCACYEEQSEAKVASLFLQLQYIITVW